MLGVNLKQVEEVVEAMIKIEQVKGKNYCRAEVPWFRS